MTQVESLKISLLNFSNETTRISQTIDSKFTNFIFYSGIVDVDYKNYCMQLQGIKNYSIQLTLNNDTKIIKEKLSEMPLISEHDFQYYTWNIPVLLLFILLPVGLIVWINNYFKLSALQDKLRNIESVSGTLNFMLKALTS